MKLYPGQKKIYGLYHKIINQIPGHTVYYELFAGSAQISLLLHPTSGTVRIVLNDIDRSVTDKYNFTTGAEILNKSAIDIMKTNLSTAGTDTFIFMDPPYLHSTRPNNTKLYKYEMSDSDHVQFLASVLQLKCNCMIIHPKCDLYDKYLSNWRTIQIKVRYHNKTSVECIYMNYEVPRILQTDMFLGDDCWDRQRIKRKSDRLINKISKLPELEKNYILERLKNKFN